MKGKKGRANRRKRKSS